MGYIKTKLCSIVLFEKHRISSMSLPESAYLMKLWGSDAKFENCYILSFK